MNYHVQDTWPQEILTNLPNVVEGKEIGHRQTDGEHKDLENYEKQGGKARASHDDVVLKGDSLNVGKLLPALKAGNGCHQTKVDNKQGCCHEQLEPSEVLGDCYGNDSNSESKDVKMNFKMSITTAKLAMVMMMMI